MRQSSLLWLGLALSISLLTGCPNKNTPEDDPNLPKNEEVNLKEPDPTNAEELYTYAEAIERRGDENTALKYYLQATQVNPEHLKAHIALAQLYVKFNRPGEAKVAYENVLRLDRNHPFIAQYKEARLKYYSALNIAQNEEYDKALKLLSEAPRNTPLDAEIEETVTKWKALASENQGGKQSEEIIQQASLLAYKGQYKDAIALINTAPDARDNEQIREKIAQWEKALEGENTSSSDGGESVRFIASEKVNIRQSPYLYAQSLASLKRGEQVSVLMDKAYQSDGYYWSKVKTSSGIVGWVAANLLSETKSSPVVPSLPTTAPTPAPTTYTPPPSSVSYGTRTVTADRVNVRSLPSIQSTVVGSVTRGSQVTLLSDSNIPADGYNWRKIKLSNGQEGYIAYRFLEGGSVSTAATPVYKQVNAAHVNIRTSPTTAAEVVARVSSPEKVELISEAVDRGNYTWVKVKTNSGKTGWVATRYLGVNTEDSRYIAAEFVNIRASASTSAKIVRVLKKGAKVTVLSSPVSANGHSWLKVQMPGGGVGWVATEYLKR